jgi:hypothetical protein
MVQDATQVLFGSYYETTEDAEFSTCHPWRRYSYLSESRHTEGPVTITADWTARFLLFFCPVLKADSLLCTCLPDISIQGQDDAFPFPGDLTALTSQERGLFDIKFRCRLIHLRRATLMALIKADSGRRKRVPGGVHIAFQPPDV